MSFFRKFTHLGSKLSDPKKILNNTENTILNMNLKKCAALLLISNLGYYYYLQRNSSDFNSAIYVLTKLIKFKNSTSRWVSRCTGWVAQQKIPNSLRKPIFELYSKVYEVNKEDMIEPDLEKYENFLEFFTRKVKPREFDKNENTLVSPADSRVLSFTEIHTDSVLLVKSINYSLGELLTGNQKYKFEGLMQNELKKAEDPSKTKLYSIIFYLAPGDYHRFHAPCRLSLKSRNHILGHLAPVKISHISKTPRVYETNERVTLFGEYDEGFMALCYVGAMNVGSIKLHFDDKLITNTKLLEKPKNRGNLRLYSLKNEGIAETWAQRGINILKGYEMGMFELGSTVVIVFEAEKVDWKVEPGQKIRWGEPFAVVGKRD